MGIGQIIRGSRLGSCWKCMTFSVAMLLLTTCAFYVSLHLQSLEESGLFGSDLFVLGVLIGACAFALLTAAHAVCLVLRFTVWSDARDANQM